MFGGLHFILYALPRARKVKRQLDCVRSAYEVHYIIIGLDKAFCLSVKAKPITMKKNTVPIKFI